MSHAASFGRVAEAYERGRPGYPAALVEWRAGRTAPIGTLAADVAAGTGKFTRLLEGVASRLIAVEPAAEMRALCAELVPAAHVIGGRAEEIPLASGCLDLLTCAQAFHWFATPAVLDELARVLRPGGELLLVWNEHFPVAAAHRRALELEATHRPAEVPDAERGDWRWALEVDRNFRALATGRFRHDQLVDRAGLLDRIASMSVFAALDREERDELFAEVLGLVEDDEIVLGYETRAYAFSRC